MPKRKVEEEPPEVLEEDDDDGKRYRSWVFTVNREAKEWLEHWRSCDLPEAVTFIGGQLEKAPTTGHVHFQGCVEVKTVKTLKQVKSLLQHNPWLAPRRGSFEKAYERYCKKKETRLEGEEPLERGEKPKGQGHRTDLKEVAQAIKVAKCWREVVESYPEQLLLRPQGVRALYDETHRQEARRRPTIFYLWGPSRAGKTRLAQLMFPDAYSLSEHKDGWFGNYRDEEVVIFEDFEGVFPKKEMLRVLDYCKMDVWVKQSQRPLRAHTFVFTSNVHPDNMYLPDNVPWRERLREFGTVWDAATVADKLKELLEKGKSGEQEGLPPSQAPTVELD